MSPRPVELPQRLVFEGVQLRVYEMDGRRWLLAFEVAAAMGFSTPQVPFPSKPEIFTPEICRRRRVEGVFPGGRHGRSLQARHRWLLTPSGVEALAACVRPGPRVSAFLDWLHAATW